MGVQNGPGWAVTGGAQGFQGGLSIGEQLSPSLNLSPLLPGL